MAEPKVSTRWFDGVQDGGADVIAMPAPVVITATIAGVSMFGFMLLFFRSPKRGLSAMQRLYLSWVCGALVWIACVWQQLPPAGRYTGKTVQDLVCGVLVLCCFIWASYWSANLGGGFRVLMLLDLAKSSRRLTLANWMSEYGQQRGMREFLRDRLGSILVPLGLVTLERDRVRLTDGRGKALAMFLRILSFALLKRPR